MDSLWLVEEGAYSDYEVVAIFRTQAEAEDFARHRPGAETREWVLDTWNESKIEFMFCFDLTGRIIEEEEWAYPRDPEDSGDGLSPRCSADRRYAKNIIRISVTRGPRDLAIKIASERYAHIRAFLDEADERVARANYQKIGDYRWNDALQVAKILAGLEPPPNPPRCDHDRNILTILALPKKAA